MQIKTQHKNCFGSECESQHTRIRSCAPMKRIVLSFVSGIRKIWKLFHIGPMSKLIRPIFASVYGCTFTNCICGLLAHMTISTTQIFCNIVTVNGIASNYRTELFEWRQIKSTPAFTVAYYTHILGHNTI